MTYRMLERMASWPFWAKAAVLMTVDGALVLAALSIALAGTSVAPDSLTVALPAAVGVMTAALIVAARFSLYRMMVRHGDRVIVVASGKTALIVATALGGIAAIAQPATWSPQPFLVFAALMMVGLAGPRMLASLAYHRGRSRLSAQSVVIYGAGQAGLSLSAALLANKSYRLVALIDDCPRLQGRFVHGVQVCHPDALPGLIAEEAVQSVILAMPSVSLGKRRQIISTLEPLPVRVQTLPSMSSLLDLDHLDMRQVRDVSAEELLWREPVAPVRDLLERDVAGNVVAVTGGGGSIGSEICRQALRLGARKLLVIEQSEFALYRIERELLGLRDSAPDDVEIVPVLANILDSALLAATYAHHEVDTVYHAAAYKHVPLIEENPLAGLMVNVIGTYRVARAAEDARVAKMVFISTDKAVRPTNVMGASKRMAEQVLQAMSQSARAARRPGPVFGMVRFGNVLDSAGSVVPLFREQIARGGPVTVTHRDITRYFMTIPEAVQLVLQAGAMTRGGDVFLLDMGEPVRIYDLAARMIRLSGFTVRDTSDPGGQIEIQVVGLRPGEKLYEELLIGDAVEGSEHPMIMRAQEDFMPLSQLTARLDDLAAACTRQDVAGALRILCSVVPEYRPSDAYQAIIAADARRQAEVAHYEGADGPIPLRPAV